MRHRLLAALAVAGLAAGGTALAQDGPDPYQLPEPTLRAGDVLQLAGASGCDRNERVRVRFTPPAGAVFGWLEIEIRGRQAVRLTGVARAASATVALPHGRSTMRVTGETLGGQRIATSRTYRTCERERPAAPPPPGSPIRVGGGEG